MNIQERLAQFAAVRLAADRDALNGGERRMVPLLLEAAKAMEDAFWMQHYGDREALLSSAADPGVRRLMLLNYGPWDRLRGGEPFVDGAGPRPPGANYYPPDITRAECDAAAAREPALKSPYTMVRRDEQGNLLAIPYHRFFADQVQLAAGRLRQAAELADVAGLRRYLNLRADALLTDDFRASDYAWMEMKENTLDILIGPMEIADRLFGIKRAYAASILIKDWTWHDRLAQYTRLMPSFQEALPVPEAYKSERPGLEGELNVYDVLHFAGYDRMGPPMGTAWPDDEEVQLRKGTRSLLMRNAMHAQFEQIILPMSDLLIAADQRPHVTFEAYFRGIMLHELAHGLGVRHTISGSGLVREALGELAHPLEEAKADLLSLVMLAQLHNSGHIGDAALRDSIITALGRLLYQADGMHAVARLNAGIAAGAYSRDADTGKYRVHLERLQQSASALAGTVLRLQGDGDYEQVSAFFDKYGQPDEALQHDLARLDKANIPLVITVASED